MSISDLAPFIMHMIGMKKVMIRFFKCPKQLLLLFLSHRELSYCVIGFTPSCLVERRHVMLPLSGSTIRQHDIAHGKKNIKREREREREKKKKKKPTKAIIKICINV